MMRTIAPARDHQKKAGVKFALAINMVRWLAAHPRHNDTHFFSHRSTRMKHG